MGHEHEDPRQEVCVPVSREARRCGRIPAESGDQVLG
jgi:hypothetical protein